MAVLLRYPRKKTWVGSGFRCALCTHILVILLALLFGAAAAALVVLGLLMFPLPPFYMRVLSFSAAGRNELADPWTDIPARRDGGSAITLHGPIPYDHVSVEVCATLWLHVVGLVSDCTSVTLGDLTAHGCEAAEAYSYSIGLAARREYPHSCTQEQARWPENSPALPQDLSDPGLRPCAGAIEPSGVAYSCITRPDATAEIRFFPAAGSFPVTLYTVFWIGLFCLLVAATAFAATYKALAPLVFAAARADGGLRCYLEDWAPEGQEPCARAAIGEARRAGDPAAPFSAQAGAVPWPSRSWGRCDASASQALS